MKESLGKQNFSPNEACKHLRKVDENFFHLNDRSTLAACISPWQKLFTLTRFNRENV
jgi:hypothetical protein